MEHFNKLTPTDTERLALLMEECGEVQQIIGKILRHGYESCHPDDKRKRTNRMLLEKELGHVEFAIRFMDENEDIDIDQITNFMKLKNMMIGQYLHHQEFSGVER